MKNNHSESGMYEDLIRSIVQLICSEGHIKTLIEKKTAELENGLIDDSKEIAETLESIENLHEELKDIADIRRRMMYYLWENNQGDKTYWCQVKHLASAMFTAFEAWQASNDDAMLYEMALDVNKQFIKALTHFMGFEVTMCASCFSDFLKGEENNEN